jgi:Fic family protein
MDPQVYRHPEAGKVIQTPTGYLAFIPAPLPPGLEWSTALVSALSAAERDLSKLAALAGVFPYPRLLVQPFMHTEAVISSRIEGTRASLEDLYVYETTQLSFFEEIDDVREVHNYVRAMQFGLERLKTLPVCLRFIRELHAILMENVRGGTLTTGEFRRSQNWIGIAGSTLSNATYVPPPPDEMHQALGELEAYIHAASEIPALIRIAMIHYQFEAIHPFLDGNGRVGRLLIALLLSEWKLLPQPLLNLSVYIESYRQEYYDRLLAVSQKGEWEAWLIFFLRGVSQQACSGLTRMERLQNLRTVYQPLINADRNPVRFAAVIDYIFSRPILTAKQAAADLDIPFKTALNYLEKLQQAGVIRETTGYARNRIYRSDEILKLMG